MCALDGGRDEGGVSSANAIWGERFRVMLVVVVGVREGEGGCSSCGFCDMAAAVFWSERKSDSGQGTTGRPVPRWILW